MKPFYLNTTLPKLYFTDNQTYPFYLPFNVSGVLLLIEKDNYRPIWITTSLIELCRKDRFLNKSSIPKIEFLIENKIIPNFNFDDFKKWVDLSVREKKEQIGKFSKSEVTQGLYDNTLDSYEPRFIPLYKKNGALSYVFFYLSSRDVMEQAPFSQNKNLKDELENIKRVNEQLFQHHSQPIITVDHFFNISNFNKPSENLFSRLSKKEKNNFLDLWNMRNQTKVFESIQRTRKTQEEELIIFEEIEDRLKKLKLKFLSVPNTENDSSTILVSIENLNKENDKEKELTQKRFLLQSTHFFTKELEENEATFIQNITTFLIKNFELNGMYWINFQQKSKEKYLISFPTNKTEDISYAIYQSHFIHFNQIIRRNVKQIRSNKIFGNETDFNYILRKSSHLLGVPLYEGEKQMGVMVYLSDSKKTEMETLSQLYSLTYLFYKIYIFQEKQKDQI